MPSCPCPPLALLLGLLALLPWGGARAQATEKPRAACVAERGSLGAPGLIGITADWVGPAGQRFRPPVEIATTRLTPSAGSGRSVELLLSAPPVGMLQAGEWQTATFLAAARLTTDAGVTRGLRALVVARRGEADQPEMLLRVQVPVNTSLLAETWLIAVAACSATTAELLGYAIADLEVQPAYLPGLFAVLVTLGVYLIAVAAVWRCNARTLQAAWMRQRWLPGQGAGWRWAWKALVAANPVFVSQDATGFGSLARLQILLFSLAAGFVSLHIFFANGVIGALSNDVLWLLGIAVGSGTLARFVPTNAGLKPGNRLWLRQRQALAEWEDRMPQLRDIVSADGEIDVARVQAVIFSAVTLLALLVNGLGDLSNFKVPSEVQYLLGLSQVAYIAGKAIPAESIRALDQAIDALRAADAVAQATADPQARSSFEQARGAASQALADVFGERFRKTAFDAMQPGREAA
ncbi:hypothetical protein [Paracraurococcus ruber]|uniref:Uncharacterized protein n=1 Tax=Paracraurococcus ruber TaxID=77675 RepID=A0ABS1D665_9PROT|nr:hypothetical protein [Paracraurococcus ruber]MBK1661983.1 hypothetical protein [Paracraurococcus ruber]TDG16380.1 hypothetical protein E2C05_29290 [Paracraurococcus ruber]